MIRHVCLSFLISGTLILVGFGQGDFEKGISFYKQGQYARAVEEFEAIVEANPEYEAGYRVLGDSYLQLKRYAEAARAFQNAIKLQDDNFVSHYGLAVAQFNLGRYQDAAATLLKAENYARSPRDRYQVFSTRGAAYYNQERYAQAIVDLKQAVSIQRGVYQDVLQLGLSYYHTKEFDQAQQFLEQARALNPSAPEPAKFLARLDYQRALQAIESQNYQQAAALLSDYVKSQPDDGEAWFNLGLAQLFADNLSAAEQSFLKSSSLLRDSWESHQRLGFIYEKTNRYRQALQHYQSALKINQSAELQESVERVQERIRRQGS